MDLAWGLLGFLIISVSLAVLITLLQDKLNLNSEQVALCTNKLMDLAKLVTSGLVGYLAGKGGI